VKTGISGCTTVDELLLLAIALIPEMLEKRAVNNLKAEAKK